MPARMIKRTPPILINWQHFSKNFSNLRALMELFKDLVSQFSNFYYIAMFLLLPK